MEKTVKAIGIAKWICFPLGYIMFFCTSDSFGDSIGVALGVAATVGFWALMRKEQTRLIGQSIAITIKDAIAEVSNIENIIEIKRIKRGIIARVYLINSRDRSASIHKSITSKIDCSEFKKYLWIMQLTDMPSRNSLKETQKVLNDQLLEELLKKQKGDQ